MFSLASHVPRNVRKMFTHAFCEYNLFVLISRRKNPVHLVGVQLNEVAEKTVIAANLNTKGLVEEFV